MIAEPNPFRPPAPVRRSEAMTFARLFVSRRRDLLSLLPSTAYQVYMSKAPATKRPIWIVNHPKTVREILDNRSDIYVKSELTIAGMKPLAGDGILVSDGENWARQHQMIAAAFGRNRLPATHIRMAAGIDDVITELKALGPGATVDLGEIASRLSASAIFRALFSRTPASADGGTLIEALQAFSESAARVNPAQMLTETDPTELALDSAAIDAAVRVRAAIGSLIDLRLRRGNDGADILGSLIGARDPETGKGFERDDLVDQIASFLLAGHETAASALTWALFILSEQPAVADRIAGETRAAVGDGPILPVNIPQLTYTTQVFKETLRLYPPLPFITRTALDEDRLRGFDIAAGDLIVISPWLIHRHDHFWEDPDRFDPDRFSAENEMKRTPGAFMPFGTGPRACIGSTVALSEGVLVLALLSRVFRFKVTNAKSVEPVCRMTVRPDQPIRARIQAA